MLLFARDSTAGPTNIEKQENKTPSPSHSADGTLSNLENGKNTLQTSRSADCTWGRMLIVESLQVRVHGLQLLVQHSKGFVPLL